MKKMKNNEGKDGKRRYGQLTWREDSTSDLARLRKLVYAGAKLRWGELKDCVVDRLEFELESIEGFGRTAYMTKVLCPSILCGKWMVDWRHAI